MLKRIDEIECFSCPQSAVQVELNEMDFFCDDCAEGLERVAIEGDIEKLDLKKINEMNCMARCGASVDYWDRLNNDLICKNCIEE